MSPCARLEWHEAVRCRLPPPPPAAPLPPCAALGCPSSLLPLSSAMSPGSLALQPAPHRSAHSPSWCPLPLACYRAVLCEELQDVPAFADYTPPAGTLVPAGQFIWQAYLVRAAPIPGAGPLSALPDTLPPPLWLQLDMTGRDGPSTCLSSAHPRRTHWHGEMPEMCREAVGPCAQLPMPRPAGPAMRRR